MQAQNSRLITNFKQSIRSESKGSLHHHIKITKLTATEISALGLLLTIFLDCEAHSTH